MDRSRPVGRLLPKSPNTDFVLWRGRRSSPQVQAQGCSRARSFSTPPKYKPAWGSSRPRSRVRPGFVRPALQLRVPVPYQGCPYLQQTAADPNIRRAVATSRAHTPGDSRRHHILQFRTRGRAVPKLTVADAVRLVRDSKVLKSLVRRRIAAQEHTASTRERNCSLRRSALNSSAE